MKHAVMAAFAAAGMVLGGVASAADAGASQQQLLQQMQDRAQIEALMWRYARALDSLDARAYAAVFTEDGQFGTGEGAVKGRAALTKMVEDLVRSREERKAKGEPVSPGTLHMVTNHVIEFRDADHATYRAYWLTAFPGAGAETPARVAAVGHSVDELVRVDGQWLIRVRNTAGKD